MVDTISSLKAKLQLHCFAVINHANLVVDLRQANSARGYGAISRWRLFQKLLGRRKKRAREREKEREKEGEKKRERKREREKEKEREFSKLPIVKDHLL